ncbi:anthranilate 1,2-dioxygenase electron transfer component AntC [Acinetobacter sp. 197]|uniref:anthranilate 1,2-dioxygenase electron transfer component AntC n=1 Tax=Acinetobacter sp. 197 TaxID=3114696 RepID=UPI003A860B67
MGHSAALNFADGKTFFIDVQDHELLLDAAVRQGITLPLDCREGVCATCQGQCDSGQYEQDYVDEDALTEQDLKDRKILACQTRLKSNATFYFDHASTFCQAGEALKVQATVTALEWASDETVILKLDASHHPQPIQFLAGQYARIYVPETGGYRAYSFAHAPTANNQLQFLIRYLPDGLMGQFLKSRCQVGQSLELEVPFGSFYLRESESDQTLYFIAGGTGLSTFLAMLDQMLPSNQAIHLYYAVRHEVHLCEQERIASYKAKFPNLLYQPVISRPTDNWQGLQGYVQDHLAPDQLKNNAFDMYVCGPPALVEALKSHLAEHRIENCHFYSEKFIAAAGQLDAA